MKDASTHRLLYSVLGGGGRYVVDIGAESCQVNRIDTSPHLQKQPPLMERFADCLVLGMAVVFGLPLFVLLSPVAAVGWIAIKISSRRSTNR